MRESVILLFCNISIKKRIQRIAFVLFACCLLTSCNSFDSQKQEQYDSEAAADQPVWLNMNKEFPETTNLPDGNGQKAKVIILIGQSNATGCSLTSYLEKNLGEEAYAKYETGFSNIRINYWQNSIHSL